MMTGQQQPTDHRRYESAGSESGGGPVWARRHSPSAGGGTGAGAPPPSPRALTVYHPRPGGGGSPSPGMMAQNPAARYFVEQPRDFPSQRAPVVQQQQQQPGYYYHQQPYSPQQQQQPLAEGTTTSYSVLKPVPESDIYRVGIYGWRKRCLYAFVLVLTVVIFVNLAFTFWIMTVLNFNTEGIGALKIEPDRIRVRGRAEFDKPVQFSRLSASGDEVLSINAGNGVHISAHNASGHSTASLNLKPDGKASVVCDRFEVLDAQKKLLFFVDTNEIGHKLENLRVLDDGGSIFEGAIQTGRIRPDFDQPLALESPTRSLRIEAGQDVELASGAGEVVIDALLDVRINAKQGEVHIEASAVYISGLEHVSSSLSNSPPTNPNPNANRYFYQQQQHQREWQQQRERESAYQLCVCPNGRLFLAVHGADCRADPAICNQ